MIRRFWTRLCPRCLRDEAPMAEHPALAAMDRTAARLDHLLDLLAPYEPDPRSSGNRLRDMAAGARADRESLTHG